jgi:hypothetical protein
VLRAPVALPLHEIVTTFSPGCKYSYILKSGYLSDLLYQRVNVVDAPVDELAIVYVAERLSEESPSSLDMFHWNAILAPTLSVSPYLTNLLSKPPLLVAISSSL